MIIIVVGRGQGIQRGHILLRLVNDVVAAVVVRQPIASGRIVELRIIGLLAMLLEKRLRDGR